MQKVWALIGSAVFLGIAPGTILVLIPWSITAFRLQPAFFGLLMLPYLRALLIVAGVVPLLNSFLQFALKGLGTPAPIAPPSRLVVSGFYRYVRNPIYVALVIALLGETLLLGDTRLLVLAAVFWLGFHFVVVFYEE